MNNAKDGPVPHVEVPDPAAAFRKMEDAARQILSVPKGGIGAGLRKPDAIHGTAAVPPHGPPARKPKSGG